VLDAYSLGFGDPIADQCRTWRGRRRPVRSAPAACRARGARSRNKEDEEDGPLKLAIVGRPNAGKSTLVNRMVGEERLITGPEAGITRDSISLDWQWQRPAGPLVDTAGLRKRAKVTDKLEKWLSTADARRAIDHAEVVVLLLDATRGLEAQDLRIAEQVIEEGRALIIAINKWDVAELASSLFNGIKAALDEGLAQIKGVPVLTVSAKTGKGIDQLLGAAFELREQWSRRIGTGELNRWFETAHRSQSAAGAQGQADQAALHHPGEEPAAEFRPVRHPHERASRKLSPLSAQFHAARPRLGPVPLRLTLRSPKNPFDSDKPNFTLSVIAFAWDHCPGHGR
jgi:GTPase